MYRLSFFSSSPLPIDYANPILNESTLFRDAYDMFPDPDDMDFFPG